MKLDYGEREETERQLVDRLHRNAPGIIRRIRERLESKQSNERHFTCQIEGQTHTFSSIEGTVHEANMAIGWMVGGTLEEIKPWLLQHKAKVQEILN